MDMRILLKNYALIGIGLGVLVGLLLGLLLGNLPLGLILAVGIAVGVIALMEEFDIYSLPALRARLNQARRALARRSWRSGPTRHTPAPEKGTARITKSSTKAKPQPPVVSPAGDSSEKAAATGASRDKEAPRVPTLFENWPPPKVETAGERRSPPEVRHPEGGQALDTPPPREVQAPPQTPPKVQAPGEAKTLSSRAMPKVKSLLLGGGVAVGVLALMRRLGSATKPKPPATHQLPPASSGAGTAADAGVLPGTAKETSKKMAEGQALPSETAPTVEEAAPQAAAPIETPAAETPTIASTTASTAASTKKIVLVAGTGQQLGEPAMAKDLYTNPLFQLNLKYAESLEPDDIFILSAEHYLLRPDEVIEPYGAFLSTMNAAQTKDWAVEVLKRLEETADLEADRVIILAASKHRKHLVEGINHAEVPTEGLTLAQQMEFLREETDEAPPEQPS
ncbi:MAG: hypothetical protein M3511_05660 [Deinococcota bacterium]|nr:hypothetical protein [Deinococcota bacterium]